jgi:hypothetical protein
MTKPLLRAVLVTAALFLLVAALCVVVRSNSDPDDDPFTAKYRLIQEGTTIEEAAQLLGPPFDDEHPGASMGDHIYYWKCPDGLRTIEVRWDLAEELSEKQLLAKDGTLISSEQFGAWRQPKPWWERFLTSVGLR